MRNAKILEMQDVEPVDRRRWGEPTTAMAKGPRQVCGRRRDAGRVRRAGNSLAC